MSDLVERKKAELQTLIAEAKLKVLFGGYDYYAMRKIENYQAQLKKLEERGTFVGQMRRYFYLHNVGIVESGDMAGNRIWEHTEEYALQQWDGSNWNDVTNVYE